MPTPSHASDHLDTPASEWIRAGREPDLELPLPGPDGKPSRTLRMRFRRVPAGSFRMGSRGQSLREEPVHRVQLDEFWLGKFVVPQEEWAAVARLAEWPAEEGRDFMDPSYFKGARLPVERVSWNDVQRWMEAINRWLQARASQKARVGHLRLPTEAEWEYACRAGTRTEYWSGDGEEALAAVGWYGGNSGGRTHPVDESPSPAGLAHPLGLVGLHGNVDEWCADVFDRWAYRKRGEGWRSREWTREDAGFDSTAWGRSTGAEEDPVPVIRGGSWGDSAGWCRSADRNGWRPVGRYRYLGFRVCLVRGPADQPADRKADEGMAGAGKPQTRDGSEAHGTGRPEGKVALDAEAFSGEAGRIFLKKGPHSGL